MEAKPFSLIYKLNFGGSFSCSMRFCASVKLYAADGSKRPVGMRKINL